MALGASSVSAQQQEAKREPARWSVEPSLYLFLPGLTGTVGIGPIDIDLDSPSSAVIHLNFAALGTVRVAHGPWALTTDVLYANLDTTQGSLTLTMHQLLVEPTLSYRVFPWLEPLAGFRYFSVGGDLDGPTGRAHAITQGWFDPIFGANLQLSLSASGPSSPGRCFRSCAGRSRTSSRWTPAIASSRNTTSTAPGPTGSCST